MSRELRARLEELQQQIKVAQAALAEPEPLAFVEELAAKTAAATAAEKVANELERQARQVRVEVAAMREDVESAEQRVLAAKAQSAVPLVSILTTFSALGGALYGWVTLWSLPHTPALVLAVKLVAAGMLLPAAWVVKRRLLVPASSNARFKP